MISRPNRCLVSTMLGLVLLGLPAPVPAADAVKTFHVREYNSRGQYLIGAAVSVEGRLSVSTKTELHFRNCSVPFRSVNGPLRLPEKARFVEVTGRTAQETDSKGITRAVFFVESLRSLDDDLTLFNARHGKLRLTDPADAWYKLAEWARERGEFNDDRELLARADEAYAKGVQVERRTLSAESPERLLQFAEGLKSRVPESVKQALIHEYCVRKVELARKLSGPERSAGLKDAGDEISRRLTGSTRTLTAIDKPLEDAYRKSPQKVYDDALDFDDRKLLHRHLFVQVQEERLLGELAADGGNGFEIAKNVDELLPERHTLAESLREKALAAKSLEVASLGRAEVLELAKQFRDRSEDRKAEQVLESWLMLRRRKLDPDDLEGLMELSEQYRTLLRQPVTANRLLIEASKKHAANRDLKAELEELGYRLDRGQWLTQAEYNDRPDARQERAMLAGEIVAGMTAAQVRHVHGQPKSVARAVSRGQVNEIWTYQLSDSRRLAVRLTRFAFRDLQVTESMVLP